MQKKGWQIADTIEYGILKENAKANRNNQTEAESIFWSIAKGSGLGEKCRRQYIIGDYKQSLNSKPSTLNYAKSGVYHFSNEGVCSWSTLLK